MSAFSDKLIMFEAKDLPTLARLVANEIRNELAQPLPDDKRLTSPALAKELGIGADRIRSAIRAGHYGSIHRGEHGRDVFYATVSEARQYHFPKQESVSKNTSFRKVY